MTKNNNKGFSLVELIVVIAIMAVLIGVLGPALIGNIEKSRESSDLQTLDTVYIAIETAISDDTSLNLDEYLNKVVAIDAIFKVDAATRNTFEKAVVEYLKDSKPSLGATNNSKAAIYFQIDRDVTNGTSKITVFAATKDPGETKLTTLGTAVTKATRLEYANGDKKSFASGTLQKVEEAAAKKADDDE